MGKLTNAEVFSELQFEYDYCIICRKNRVSWPMVCGDCQDKVEQEFLFSHFFDMGYAGWDENDEKYCDMECSKCGMILNTDLQCKYCGNVDVKVIGTDEADYYDDDVDFEMVRKILENGLYEEIDD